MFGREGPEGGAGSAWSGEASTAARCPQGPRLKEARSALRLAGVAGSGHCPRCDTGWPPEGGLYRPRRPAPLLSPGFAVRLPGDPGRPHTSHAFQPGKRLVLSLPHRAHLVSHPLPLWELCISPLLFLRESPAPPDLDGPCAYP